jgi:general secretion pathway protein D
MRAPGFAVLPSLLVAGGVMVAPPGAVAQQDAAVATAPKPAPAAGAPAAAPALPGATPTRPGGRRVIEGAPTVLAFKEVPIDQIVSFIVEATGKVVIPQKDVMNRKVTVINDQPIARDRALDLVILALQQSGVAVVESGDTITLRDMNEIDRQDVPVIGPDESVLGRTDLGTIAEKVYALKHVSAEQYATVLKDAIPKFAKLTVDKESNQVAVMGNISLLQRIENLISSLDRQASDALVTETFRLHYADSAQIVENIRELYAAESGRGPTRGKRTTPDDQNQRRRFGGQQNEAAAPSENLRVSANSQQNTVTVVSEPAVVEEIRSQIENFWDLPLPKDAVVPRTYELKNSDPIKVQNLLQRMFGQGSPASAAAPQQQGGQGGGQRGGQGGGGGGNAAPAAPGTSQGVGRLAGQFSFQAIPETGRLVVVARTPDNLNVIDEIIADLDKPQTVGLPEIVELKHASAEELGEQLNTLLALDGTLATIRRSATGLTTTGAVSNSPFSTTQQTANAAQGQNPQDTTTPPDTIAFWWQRSRPPTDSRGSSNLVGQIRLVPVWRQNALMVLAPPEYRHSIAELIAQLDKPGRQVLISAIVVEVSRDDATSLGFRWSSQPLSPTNPDNSLSIGTTNTNTKNDFLPSLFDTSVLNANVNLNFLLQALAQKTGINILSEPKIFTSDNQQAEFFNGQDIPFVTNSQTTTTGNVIQSFDYRAVGIALRARPRITINGDVDLQVNVELSSIVPGQTLFGGFIVDRRETTTQLIVKNGQTVVISGIMRSEETNIVRKIPLLGDIPWLGAIFRSIDKEKKDTELLVFVTPVVQETTDNAKEVNEPYIKRLDQIKSEHEQMEKQDTVKDKTDKPRASDPD